MKKVLSLSLSLLLLIMFVTGCGTTKNTPTSKVEEFLGKYQKMDSDVLTQLDSVVSSDSTMSDDQKEEYRALMEKQYQNMSYKIVDENIDEDSATVDVEIEVFDYATSINESKAYYEEHKDEIETETESTVDEEDRRTNDDSDTTVDDEATENKDDNTTGDNTTTSTETKAYIDYKIKQMKNVTDKVKHTITFNLIKEDNEWKVQDISDLDRQKIHGLFNS